MKAEESSSTGPEANREIVLLLTGALLLGAYVAMRYGGLWGETDTSVFARAIRAMIDEASLVPDAYAYTNGYGFSALGTFLVHITGLTVAQLQLYGGVLLVVWIVVPAWLAYRVLTGSTRAATLATVIIFVQPEFLFPILRGTHEKFTRGLMFMALYLLVSSVLSRQHTRRLIPLILMFYLVVYALIAFNNLFATSFFVALGLALLLSLTVRWFKLDQFADNLATRRRLFYSVSISIVLGFFFTFYVYEPAAHGLMIIDSISQRIAMLFLEVEETVVNPYTTVSTAWVTPQTYWIVSIANWILLSVSLILWVGQTFLWLWHRTWPNDPRTNLLWSLFGSFGFLGAVSILVDLSGSLSSNLQHRIFPSFAMIAAALIAEWLVRVSSMRPAFRRVVNLSMSVLIAGLSVIAVAKATNEPLLSTKWQYYTPAEFVALDWTRRAIPDGLTWTDYDERMKAALGICCNWETPAKQLFVAGPIPWPGMRDLLISPVIRSRSERFGVSLLYEGDSYRVYDNGGAQIFHLRPQTPFQK